MWLCRPAAWLGSNLRGRNRLKMEIVKRTDDVRGFKVLPRDGCRAHLRLAWAAAPSQQGLRVPTCHERDLIYITMIGLMIRRRFKSRAGCTHQHRAGCNGYPPLGSQPHPSPLRTERGAGSIVEKHHLFLSPISMHAPVARPSTCMARALRRRSTPAEQMLGRCCAAAGHARQISTPASHRTICCRFLLQAISSRHRSRCALTSPALARPPPGCLVCSCWSCRSPSPQSSDLVPPDRVLTRFVASWLRIFRLPLVRRGLGVRLTISVVPAAAPDSLFLPYPSPW